MCLEMSLPQDPSVPSPLLLDTADNRYWLTQPTKGTVTPRCAYYFDFRRQLVMVLVRIRDSAKIATKANSVTRRVNNGMPNEVCYVR